MKKTVKTSVVIDVYNFIKDAKFSKMDDADKVAMWKICKVIKPIGEAFVKDTEDARESFIPYEGFMEDLSKARLYEMAKQKKEPYKDMSDEEYKKFIGEWVKYNNLIGKAIEDIIKKDIELEFDPLSKEGLEQLMLSNDWTFNQGELIESLVCE